MNVTELLSQIQAEIFLLKQARAILVGTGPVRSSGKKKRVMSAEARAKIAAAQRKRWAKQKKAAK
jgi:hypothetical protein